MSKSLGNFVLGKDIIDRFGGQVLRWIMNATHYRAPINFTDEVFASATSEINKIYSSLKQASLKLDPSNAFKEVGTYKISITGKGNYTGKNGINVKKTLTIPKWLDEMAKAKNVNFSAILVKGLKAELGLRDR